MSILDRIINWFICITDRTLYLHLEALNKKENRIDKLTFYLDPNDSVKVSDHVGLLSVVKRHGNRITISYRAEEGITEAEEGITE